LVDQNHPQLSIRRQCELLGLAKSTLYYKPVPVRAETLRIMARIDAWYLADPASGSRRMVDYLAADRIEVGRDRVRHLMRRMGLRALYPKSRTSFATPPKPCADGC
jgi:putative transposase